MKRGKMKKNFKHRGSSLPARVKPDIAGLVDSMRQQLASLERKIDTLIGQSIRPSAEGRPVPRPSQPVSQHHNRSEMRQENRFRERVLHKAVCADCKKECEVPFKPSGDRPVYCKECFSKRKSSVPFGAKPDHGSGEGNVVQASYRDKRPAAENAKSAGKRKPVVKRRKK